jgi:predicted RNase H-like HicB family nuclease
MRQVVVHNAEEGGYWVECPSLPGCVSQGDTWDEVLANIKEAIELYIESLTERNLPFPR